MDTVGNECCELRYDGPWLSNLQPFGYCHHGRDLFSISFRFWNAFFCWLCIKYVILKVFDKLSLLILILGFTGHLLSVKCCLNVDLYKDITAVLV